MKGRRASAAVLLGSIALAAAALVLDADTSGPLILLWTIVCSALMVLGTRSQPESSRGAYMQLSLVATAVSFGMLVRGVHGVVVGIDQPIPSPADLVHLPAYIFFAHFIYRVHRARTTRRSPDAWLDAIAIVLAVLTLLWVGFVGDFLFDASLSFAQRGLNLAYNSIVLASLAIVLRISATPGRRPVAYYLLLAACCAFFVVDIAGTYSFATSHGVAMSVATSPMVYGLLVLTIWHPTAAQVFTRDDEAEATIGPLRLGLIAVAVLTPLIGLYYEPTTRPVLSGAVFVTLVSALVLLIMLRVTRLLRTEADRAALERRTTDALTSLGQLETAEDIRSGLLGAVSAVFPDAEFRIVDHDDTGIQLPDRLVPGGSLVIDRSLDLSGQRALARLLRAAELLAIAADGLAASARRSSEALAAQQVAASEKRFRSLVQNASDIFIVLDAEGNTTYASDAILRVLGYEPKALLGKQLNSIVHENDQEPAARHFMAVLNGSKSQEKHEFRAYTSDGDVRLFEAIMTDMTDVPEVNGIVINGTDVTAERSLERDLKDAETIDPLTLQLNRKSFINEIDTALRRASISGAAVSIAIIDLDDFKTINDALGPVLADQALVETANRIRRAVRLGDVVARLSGDEFGVLMPDGYSALESVAAIERVLSDLQRPFELDRHPLSLKATAGLSLDAGGSDTASVLLREADTALGTAKREAPGKAVMFEEEMGSAVTERLDLRTGFERALHNDEMRLVYQPILDISTGKIVSLEALARWTHPQRGEISPNIFIPIAEDSNTITPLGEWALRTACKQVNEWTRRGLSGFTVSVNMSGQTLIEDDVISRVRSILRETGVDPSRIIIEITETVLIDDTEFIADRIAALRSLGVALAIDDFGTGYSSLSYLQRYEFDYLKIDRAFVRPLEAPENVKEREIVAAIIRLARGLGATTIAEGIEGESEHLVLQTLNCDRAQGFLFHRPKEVGEVFEILCEDLALDVAA